MTNKFTNKCNAHMLANDMRVKDFIAMLRITENTFYNYSSGALPRVDKALMIARILKVNVSELWD